MIYLNGQKIDFKTFPNGETLLNTQQLSGVAKDSGANHLIFKYENNNDLIELMFLKKYLDNTEARNTIMTLRILYMPYSRMDRNINGQAFTLKHVTDFINSLIFDEVYVTEPHSDVTMALLNRSFAEYPTLYLLDSMLDAVGFDMKVDYLFFPDTGAQKRYSKLEGFKTAVGYKSRNADTGKLTDFQVFGVKDLSESKVIIIDDLCSYGGTFYGVDGENKEFGCSVELKKLGAQEIHLFVAHCEESIFQGKIFSGDTIDKVFTTNSILSESVNTRVYADYLTIFNIIN